MESFLLLLVAIAVALLGLAFRTFSRSSPKVSHIFRYPVKSCQGQSLTTTGFDSLGLRLDRRWIVINPSNKMITGRDVGQLVLMQAALVSSDEPAPAGSVAAVNKVQLVLKAANMPDLKVPAKWDTEEDVKLWDDMPVTCGVFGAPAVTEWLTQYLGRPCRLAVTLPENKHSRPIPPKYDTLPREQGIQDAFQDAFPLLICSEESLKALQKSCGPDVTMLNFRPNIVVKGTPAWDEDSWVRVRIGAHVFNCVKPCTRCVFTTVNPTTGVRHPEGEPLISMRRVRGVHPTTGASDGSTCYFGVNAIHTTQNAVISVGDAFEVLERQATKT